MHENRTMLENTDAIPQRAQFESRDAAGIAFTKHCAKFQIMPRTSMFPDKNSKDWSSRQSIIVRAINHCTLCLSSYPACCPERHLLADVANPVIDGGREMNTPLRLLRGEMIYSEVYYLYGPVAPSFNAAVQSLRRPPQPSLPAGLAGALLLVLLIFRLASGFMSAIRFFARRGSVLCSVFSSRLQHDLPLQSRRPLRDPVRNTRARRATGLSQSSRSISVRLGNIHRACALLQNWNSAARPLPCWRL